MNWTSRLAATALVALAVAGVAGAAVARTHAVPTDASPPTISGTAAAGDTLTANPGTWNGSTPMTYRYQWSICDGDGGSCHDISGATNQTYAVQTADQGNTVRVTVVASNGDGSSSSVSVPSAKIGGAASNGPVNSTLPTIAGTTATGSTLTASSGAWTGATPITFAYQWEICGGDGTSCHDISGATGETYQLKSGDAGNTVRVRVTAANSSGSSSATSSPSAKINGSAGSPAPQPPSGSGCPKLATGATAVAVTQVASPARLQIAQLVPNEKPIPGSMTSFSLRVKVTDSCGEAVSGAYVLAQAVPFGQVSTPSETTTDGTGWVTLTFNREAGFPASRKQQLLVLFVRARRPGDPILAGISTRRLVSLRVNLKA